MEYTTMSIASLGASTLPRESSRPFQVKTMNDVSDIAGASSGPKYERFYNKPQPQQSDVPGSTSKTLSWSRNVRDNSLYIDDIDGTRHTIKDRMMRTTRRVNPLEPDYPLPTFVPADHPAPKFIKDPQYHDDIDGSTIKPKKYFATRDTMGLDDIEGARPNWKPRHARARMEGDPINTMEVQDISAPKHRFKDKTTRVTDPNRPEYRINGMEYKDDKYTKPKPLKTFIPEGHLLQTRDIPGAYPGWKPDEIIRREYRNTNFVGDIDGAKADSIKHSITTKRQSNPLMPVYQALDSNELLLPLIPPLIPSNMIKVPTVPIQRGTVSASSGPADDGGEFDPVSFASTARPEMSSKPPTGREKELHLNFAKTSEPGAVGYDSGRKVSDATLYGTTSQRSPSGIKGTGRRDSSGRIAAAAAADINAGNSRSGRFAASATFKSPGNTARSGNDSGRDMSGRALISPAARREQLQTLSDIDAIRSLK